MAWPAAGAAIDGPARHHAAAQACRLAAARGPSAGAGAGRGQTDRARAIRPRHAHHHDRTRVHRQRGRRHRQVLRHRGNVRDLRSAALRLRGTVAVQPRRRLGQGSAARHDCRQCRRLLRHRVDCGRGQGGRSARAGARALRATGAVRAIGDAAGGPERSRPGGTATGERQRCADLHGQRPGRQRPEPVPGQPAGAGQPAHRWWRLHLHRFGGPAQVRREHHRHGRLCPRAGGLQRRYARLRGGLSGELPPGGRARARGRHRRDCRRPGEPRLRLHHHPVATAQARRAHRVLHGAGQVV